MICDLAAWWAVARAESPPIVIQPGPSRCTPPCVASSPSVLVDLEPALVLIREKTPCTMHCEEAGSRAAQRVTASEASEVWGNPTTIHPKKHVRGATSEFHPKPPAPPAEQNITTCEAFPSIARATGDKKGLAM